jgi:hypothetical protein
MNISELLTAEGYVDLGIELGTYDYSWDEAHFYAKDGRVFVLADSGCSCYGFGDDWGTYDYDISATVWDIHKIVGALEEITTLARARDFNGENYLTDDHIRTLNSYGIF